MGDDMAQKMDDQIEGGLCERDQMLQEIKKYRIALKQIALYSSDPDARVEANRVLGEFQ